MARITVEDCMEHVPNRFHLVRMASIRAKQLKKGALPLLKSEENKQVVMSLREIAAGLVKPGEATPVVSASTPTASTPTASTPTASASADAAPVEKKTAAAAEPETAPKAASEGE